MLIKKKEGTRLSHSMVDIETMGTEIDCAIVSIAIKNFDPHRNLVSNDDCIYVEFDWQNQGRVICPETHKWWKGLPKQSQAALNGTTDLADGLMAILDWYPKGNKIWANPPLFDIGFIQNACAEEMVEEFWDHWNLRCYKTIRETWRDFRGEIGPPATVVTHHAMEDVDHQIKTLCRITKDLSTKTYK